MKYSIAIAIFLSAASAFAAPESNLSAYFDDQISSAQNASASCAMTSSGDAFELKQFQVGVSSTVSFKIDPLFSLSVSPEVDFTFGL